MELTPDSVLRNRYRITNLLGKGGMGAVYLAYDLSLEQQVAVKINHSMQVEATTQFLQEARLLASLRHPNLPRVIDYFIEGDNQFLVMDFIPGEDLNWRVEHQGAQPLPQVMRWAEQLGSALSYLHRQSPPITHRDVKPANIKTTPEGEVILVDFGIAKAANVNQATAAGAHGYTPGFAPPEQYGTARTGAYSDQYSLAATIYGLLTAVRPVDAVERVLGNAVLTPLAQLNPTLPPYVCAAIEHAMSIRPEDRFASVDEFIQALINPAFQPTIRATPQMVQDMSAAMAGGNIPPMAGGVPPVVGGTPTVAGGVPQPGYYPPQVPAYAPQPPYPPLVVKKSRRFSWEAFLVVLFLLAGAAVAVFFMREPGGLLSDIKITPVVATQTKSSNTAQAVTSTIPAVVASLPAVATATLTPQPVPTKTALPTHTSTASPQPTRPPLGKGGVVAFASNRGDGKTFQIWTMNVALNASGQPEAGTPVQLTRDEGNKSFPAWSPDGKKLLYSAPGGKQANGLDNGLDIFLLDLSKPDSKPVNLTKRMGDDIDAAWSKDGNWIALTNNGRSDKIRMVDIMKPDGSQMTRITVELEEFNPTWSPDGKWIAYISLVYDNNILYLRDSESNFTKNQFYDFKQISKRTGQAADPAFSPDGKLLAYTFMEGAGSGRQIHVILNETRGDQITPLTQKGRNTEPAWSPDSQWLVYTSDRDGNLEIYAMTSTGLLQVNLTNNPARDMQAVWQPLP